MKKLGCFIFLTLISISSIAQQELNINDFDDLHQSNWVGNLMYINYSDGREVNISTELKLEIKDDILIMYTSYPQEPKANGKNKIKTNFQERLFGNERIKALTKIGDSIHMTTEFEGKDNNKPAIMTKFYAFGNDKLEITKTVDYQDGNPAFVRNRYTYYSKN